MKKTKIVSTLGPASKLSRNYFSINRGRSKRFRFNFSHGDHEEQLARMN